MRGDAKAGVGVAAALVVGALLAVPAEPATGLAGKYRVTLTASELLRAGESNVGASDDAGMWTLSLTSGAWTLRQSGGAVGNSFDRGTFARRGARLLLTFVSAGGAPHHEYIGALSVQESGSLLRLAPIPPETSDTVRVLAAGSWRRVG
jgi:hypothetical protein